jgi:membrane fusion protein, multidrug efflux system
MRRTQGGCSRLRIIRPRSAGSTFAFAGLAREASQMPDRDFLEQENDVSMPPHPGRTVIVAVVTAAIFSVACEKPPAPPPPPTEVYVADVIQKDVPAYLEVVGQTYGFQDVDIRARVEGFLESMNFREGSFVRQGALLYEIDRKPLEAALAQAKADQANAQARFEKSRNDVARYTPLVAKQAVSQQELDNARASLNATQAEVEAGKAAVEKATLDLSYTRVSTPISGLVGTTRVKPGNLVGRGESTLLTTISQIDPILFKVGVSEAEYLRFVKRAAALGSGGSRPGDAPRAEGIELLLADGTRYSQTGRLTTVDRAVDPTTGTLGLEITFPNPDQLLRPGQYGRVRLLLETRQGALLVQQRAVQELQNLYSVAIVDGSGKVAFRNVKVGPKVDSLWIIEEGVKPGEKVVVEGLQRIQDGMTVVAKPAPAPAAPGVESAAKPAGEAK